MSLIDHIISLFLCPHGDSVASIPSSYGLFLAQKDGVREVSE